MLRDSCEHFMTLESFGPRYTGLLGRARQHGFTVTTLTVALRFSESGTEYLTVNWYWQKRLITRTIPSPEKTRGTVSSLCLIRQTYLYVDQSAALERCDFWTREIMGCPIGIPFADVLEYLNMAGIMEESSRLNSRLRLAHKRVSLKRSFAILLRSFRK